ncbi:MAG: DNA-binding protein [Candidatus Aminicenantes bacterium]|nr:DNA-binding protein [Candidatus Aminicenantes bacterium]
MRYRKMENRYVLRLERGERIVAALTAFCGKRKIRAGSFNGIGTCRGAELGFFDGEKKVYHWKKLKGDYEITALVGNVGVLEGKPFVHAHITLGGRDFRAWAGHLKEAETSATCEIVLRPFPGELRRAFDPASGASKLLAEG